MFGKRFGRNDAPDNGGYDEPRGGVATAEDDRTANLETNGNGTATRERTVAAPERRAGSARAAGDAVVLDRDARLRQREEYGGFNFGAAFFGWLVAIGMGVILTAIVGAAGAAIRLTNTVDANAATNGAGTIGIVGGALLIAIAIVAYYCGGYVAGRMSRFDGARQGFGVWAFGLIVTLVIAAAGGIFGDQYNVFENLNLPRIPVSTSDLTAGGAIALAAIFLGSLLGAVIGGKVGQRFHRKVDRAALGDH
jgi:amino acid transporter